MYNYPHIESIITFDGRRKFRVVANETSELEKAFGVRKIRLRQITGKDKGVEHSKVIPKGLKYREIR